MNPSPLSFSASIPTFFRHSLALLAGVLLCIASIAASAQSVTFAGAETTLPTSGLNNPTGVAVDSSGNVIISDFSNNRAVVLAKTPTGYAPQATLPTVGLSGVYGITVNVVGDVFIPDGFNSRIVELPKTETGYGPQTTLPCTTCGLGDTVALDLAGDVFFGGNPIPVGSFNSVWEIPWTGAEYGPEIELKAELNSPSNISADAGGDVFVINAGTEAQYYQAVEFQRTATGYAPPVTLPFSGLSLLYGGGIAVNSTGDAVIVADTRNNRVLEEQMTANGWGPQTTLLTGYLEFPRGLFLDSAGDVFIVDQYTNRVLELQTRSVNFGGANVCTPGATTPAPCSQSLTLNFQVNANATLGVPEVHTGGLPGLDFTLASGSTCTGAVTAGTTCAVNVNFAPQAAGFRYGSVQITANGTVIDSVELSGFGVAATTGPPVAQVSTDYMQFGAVSFGEIKTLPLTIANIGGETLTVTPSIGGYSSPAPSAFSYTIANSTCAAGVAPGNTCNLIVAFSPRSIATHDDI